jgi:hypothetical protein
MSTSIFIKTWTGDLEWLPYCLQSIYKFGNEFEKIVIASDLSCLIEVQRIVDSYHSPITSVVRVADWDNGYIQQQWVKLNADSFTRSDCILFVDSDCVFHTPFSPESFMRDGKPVLLKTKYGNLEGAEVWKDITSSFVGFDVEYEYMRRLPWMYRTSSLTNFKEKYPQTYNHLRNLQTRYFSEFNALGAFIDRYENGKYFVTDTEVWVPDSVAKQYWSWGGITPEIQTEINSFLSGGVA